MGDKRKNTGDGETPPAKGRPGLKSETVPSPVAVEAPQRPVMAPSPAAVEAAPTPVAVEKPVTAPSPAAVEAAPTPVAVEAPETAPSAMVLAGGTVAVAAAEGDVMTLLESVVPKTVLHCNECHHPLKPPLYLCSRMRHVACSDCVGVGVGGGGGDDDDDGSGDDDDGNEGGGVSGPAGDYKCSSCTDLAASVVYVKSPYLDTLLSNAKVSCPYKKYGCGQWRTQEWARPQANWAKAQAAMLTAAFYCSYSLKKYKGDRPHAPGRRPFCLGPESAHGCGGTLAFRDAAAHAAACGFAPCLCPDCSFEGLPADLVRHLTEKSGRHGWAVHKITYGKNHPYVFDELNSEKDSCQKLLVADEDDGVFVLDIVRDKDDFHFVTLVCVRNKAGAGPVYSSSVAVEGPPAKGIMVKVEKKVVPSCPAPAEWKYKYHEDLIVYPQMLHGEQIKKLHICVCIGKTESISE